MTEQPSLLPRDPSDLGLLREARGLSLSEAASQLRCSRRVLEALEAGEPTGLAPVYQRGFLRRYAALLELDPEQMDALLADEREPEPEVRTVFITRQPVQASDRWLRVASYALATLLVGTLAWQLAHEATRLAGIDAEPVAAELTEPLPGPKDPVNASLGGLESLHRPAGSRTGDAGAQAWAALNEARRAQEALAAGEHLLELETSADTWVEIQDADEAMLEQDLVRGGERRSYRGNGPFRISLGRASAVRLSLDGQAVPLEAFTREDVARLLLDPAAFGVAPPDGEVNP